MSQGERVSTQEFAGNALGSGPVRVLGGFTVTGTAPIRYDPTNGWYGTKSLWYADPSYQGPFLIRGRQLDGDGQISFGEQPQGKMLFIRAGPTINSGYGYREAPGGTYVKSPGCYAFQVDGVNFSYIITFEAIPSA